jgi:site-specific DNA-methyltransferase (adenine-specific)
VSKNQIVWGANHFISRLPYDSSCWIVWDKDNSGDFADCELAWTSFKSAVRKFKWRWNGMLQEKMGVEKEERIHPTQKPVSLYKWLLSKYAQPGNKILDTHMGSQSSRIAAYQMGFDYWGWEIDKEYFENGNKRFTEQTAQLKLL